MVDELYENPHRFAVMLRDWVTRQGKTNIEEITWHDILLAAGLAHFDLVPNNMILKLAPGPDSWDPSEWKSDDELLAEMRRSVATIPGVSVTFGQPISHRIDHMISGSKANLAVKIFGPDLSVLRRLASAAEEVLGNVPGVVDLSNQEQATVPQLALDFDRPAMARHGLNAIDLARVVEAMFQGTHVGEILEDGLVTSVVVRLAEGQH